MTTADPSQQPEQDYSERSYGKIVAFAICAIFSFFGLAAIVGLIFLFKDDLPL